MTNWRHLQRQEQNRAAQKKQRQESFKQAEKELSVALCGNESPKAIKVEPYHTPKIRFNKVLSEFAGQPPERQAAAVKRLSPRVVDLLIEALVTNRQAAIDRATQELAQRMTADGITREEFEAYLKKFKKTI